MIHIAFKILVFYKTDDALEQYINRFRSVSQEGLVTSSKNERLYLFDGVQVTCIRGLNENMRGRWADFVAVQEDLTWGDAWEEIRDSILYPMLCSPIPIQIFDGISEDKG